MTRVTAVFCGIVFILACSPSPALAGQAQPAPAAAASYNWTGLEFGAHVGANWSSTTSQTVVTTTGAAEGSGVSSTGSHVTGGIQGGYNYMLPSRLVLGVSAGAAFWGLADNSTTSIGTNVHTNENKTNWTGSAVGVFGYGAGRMLLYGTAGIGWSSGTSTRTQVTGTTGNATPGTVESVSNGGSGLTAGAGFAYGLSTHLRVGAEYRYSPRSKTLTFPLAERSTSSTTHTNGIQVGVSYRF